MGHEKLEIKEYLERSMSFKEYVQLLDRLLAEGKTTGPNQSEPMFNYGKLNRQRMDRLEKTVELNNSVISVAKNAKRRVIWLTITEGWCGDAAQNIPFIEKIAAQNGNIKARYILRDENPGLMDQFLTSGTRSIPKLIVLDATTLEVLRTWGPRPASAQKMFDDQKEQGVEKALIRENLHRWYNADRGQTIQMEFVELIEQGEGNEQGEGKQVSGARA